jgi:hypothetical protein
MLCWCALQSLLIDQHEGMMLPELVATFKSSLIRVRDERRKR